MYRLSSIQIIFNSLLGNRWIYALFLGIDGNFRLKRKKVSDDEHDPGLCNGWAFIVPEVPYKRYLADNWDYKQEVCNIKFSCQRLITNTHSAKHMRQS